MRAWHISSTRNRSSIVATGLRLSDPMTREQFDGTAPCHLWVWVDKAAAMEFLPRCWGGTHGANDLWEIDVEGLELLPDHHGGWTGIDCARTLTVPVGPERLTLVASVA
jgi:hypothetical protein